MSDDPIDLMMPVAVWYGYSRDYCGTLIDAIDDRCIAGRELNDTRAALSLRAAMSRIDLLHENDDLENPFQDLGIPLYADGSPRHLLDVLADLHDLDVPMAEWVNLWGQRAGPALATIDPATLKELRQELGHG